MSCSSDSDYWTPRSQSRSTSRKKLQRKPENSLTKKSSSQKVDLGKLSLKKPTLPDSGVINSSKTLKALNIFSSCTKVEISATPSCEVYVANSDDELSPNRKKMEKKSRVQLWLDDTDDAARDDPDYADLAMPLRGKSDSKTKDEDDLAYHFGSMRLTENAEVDQNECVIVSSSDDEDAFENFLQSLRKPKPEEKKMLITSSSFICDDSISDESDDGFYLKSLNERMFERLGGDFVPSERKNVRRSKSEADLRNSSVHLETPAGNSGSSNMISFKDDDLLKPLSERITDRIGKKERTKTPKTDRKKNKENEAPSRSSKKTFEDQTTSSVVSFLASLSSNVKPELRHRESLPYLANFKKRRNDLTQKLFLLFNREVFDNRLPQDFPITWNSRLTSTAGYCRNVLKRSDGKSVCESSIELSVKVVDTPCRLRDTLIHELCHAATWMLDECRGGHGPLWKRWANHARRVFPELPPISCCHNYEITYKYRYSCTVCSYSIGRHSKSIDTNNRVCPFCRNRLQLNSGVSETEGSAKKNANPFALFVKENYAVTKTSNLHLPHGDIMKLLSQQFKQIKIESG